MNTVGKMAAFVGRLTPQVPMIFFVVDTVEIVGSYDIVKSGK
jgi:hypothetical protein